MGIKKAAVFVILILGIGVLVYEAFLRSNNPNTQPDMQDEVGREGMKLTSSAFEEGGLIPQEYTCDGDNISPPFSISQVTQSAQSLVLIITDPDAPGGEFTHWLVWNIEPETAEIAEGSLPDGAEEGTNNFNKKGYSGPCPPTGTHHYEFRLYALDTKLNLQTENNKSELLSVMDGHITQEALLTAVYERQ